ncbi:MAG: ATP-binding protein, partial [Pseudomonadota bacterium]
LAKRLPTILPPLCLQEALETTRIYSATGKLPRALSLMATRPVRQPHHSISTAALVGAMNPCPCGYYGDPFRQCTCPPGLVSRYQRRISGPFLDRVDIFVEVPHIAYEKLTDTRLGEPSGKVQARVSATRSRQRQRFQKTRLACNAEMTPAEIREFCRVETAAQGLLQAAMKQHYLSARAFHRILKLALTIADLEASDTIKAHHVAEAIQYRPRRSE